VDVPAGWLADWCWWRMSAVLDVWGVQHDGKLWNLNNYRTDVIQVSKHTNV
jgi:hypothetical protein